MHKDNLQEVNDIYFLSQRIKQINPYYKIFYNLDKKRYEIHDTSNPKDTLCITTTEYPNFSLIKKLITTKRENMYALFKQIEEDNQRLEDQNKTASLQLSKELFREVLSFSEKTTQSLSRQQIKKIIEVNYD